MRPTPPAADLSRLVAIVPVRGLEGAKSRLGATLDAEERQALVLDLLDRTIRAARGGRRDRIGRRGEPGPDGPPGRQRGRGHADPPARHRPERRPARRRAGGPRPMAPARSWSCRPTCRRSQPTRSAPSWRRPPPARVAERPARGARRRPPRARHERAACRARPTRSRSPSASAAEPPTWPPPRRPARRSSSSTARFAIDLDPPDDLLLAEELGLRRSGPCRLTAAAGSRSSRSTGSRRSGPATTSPALLAAALATLTDEGFGPLRADDVLVVTQKIVSKAEGAIVDLTDDRATPRGRRVRRPLGSRSAPGRGRPARGAARRPDGQRA